MAESRVERIGAQLSVEASDLLTYAEIEELTTERGYPTSVRTLRFYVNEGVLPTPVKRGNVPVLPRAEILPLLFSIHLMKSRFGRSLGEIRGLLRALRGDPGLLAEKLGLLYEESTRSDRHRVERDWLVATFFETLAGTCTDYPYARAGEPGPRAVDEVIITEFLDDLTRRAEWSTDDAGSPIWLSPDAAREPDDREPGGRPTSGAPSEPERAHEQRIERAREEEERFLRRFERNLEKLERIPSPLEKRSHVNRPGLIDLQVDDPYQRVVDVLKEVGLYDRELLERLPHDRGAHFSLPRGGLFGKKPPRLIVAALVASPIRDLATRGGGAGPLDARAVEERIRAHARPGAFLVLGVHSTSGWQESVLRAPPRGERHAVVLVERSEQGAWRRAHSLPEPLQALLPVFDPETLEEKVQRAFYALLEDPELRIPGGHVEVESFLDRNGLTRDVLALAMKQVTQEDSRLRITEISGRELLKRDRF